MELSTSFKIVFHKNYIVRFFLIIIFLALYCVLFEIPMSYSFFFKIIPYPSPSLSSTFPELDVKFKRLWTYKEPNCLFIGSSMTDSGINPSVFEDLINRRMNKKYRCFNLGFSDSMAEVSSSVANSIINWENIDLIIWGVSPIDLNPKISKTRVIVNMPAFSFNNGHKTLIGFLYDRFRFPWFMSSLPHLQDDKYTGVLNEFEYLLDNQGMRRMTQVNVIQKESKPYFDDYKIPAQDSTALQNSITEFKNNGIKTIIVEMPVNPVFFPDLIKGGEKAYNDKFISPIEDIVEPLGVPFIRTQDNIATIVDNSGWANRNHLNVNGSIRFTQYLAKICENEGILP